MTNPFYLSKQWRAKRNKILRRDGYECVVCKRYGRTREAKIVHHIKELEDYPELRLTSSNLQSVCVPCHNKLHPEKGGYRRK